MANKYANLVGSNKISEEWHKINDGFDRVEQDMIEVDDKADQALQTADGLQEQLDTIVVDGDSSVEAAQARVSTPKDKTFTTLKDRLDADESDLIAHKADFATLKNATTGLFRNALINGNFDIWQRGTSFAATGYTADRWNLVIGSGATLIVTRQSFPIGQTNVPNNPDYFAQLAVTPASADSFFTQRIENVKNFSGQKVTLSFWGRVTSDTYALQCYLRQNFGNGGSPALSGASQNVTLTTTWKRHTLTFDVPSVSGKTIGDGSYIELNLRLLFASGANTVQFSQVQINDGDGAQPYQPRHKAAELALCQRYYEKSYSDGVNPATITNVGTYGIRAASAAPIATVNFNVRKRIVPTITLYSPATGATGKARDFTSSEDITAAVGNNGQSAFTINLSGTSDGNGVIGHYTADAEI